MSRQADAIHAMATSSRQVFVVHHNPNNGRYRYHADPRDAVASAKALLAAGSGTWVAGNCWNMIHLGDVLLFKFGGARLQQEPGIYAAAHVTRAPMKRRDGIWVFRYAVDAPLTRRLLRAPITGGALSRVAGRSFGASIQRVDATGRNRLTMLLKQDATRVPVSHGDGDAITHGLLVLKEWLDKILAGTKTWEIRGKATAMRGPIALIESKSGHVMGTCELVDVVGPLTLAELQRNARRAGFRAGRLPYATTYAWVVKNARRLPVPVPYEHPSGAVIWVRLQPRVTRAVERRLLELEKGAS